MDPSDHSPRRVLVTSARLPFALDAIRKLGAAGHVVFAADSESIAPGLASKHVAERFVVPPAFGEPRAFAARIAEIAAERAVDLILPAFEEAFVLARHREALPAHAALFTADFDTLARLHDKAALVELAREIGVRIAPTRIARSRAELRAAMEHFDPYFARPAFGRGGVELLTNHGPLEGALDPDEVEPTDDMPWVVQGYVEGTDVCTFGIAHHGRLVAHSAYCHPKVIADSGGIAFESIDARPTLTVVEHIVRSTGYHGHVAFDFLERDGELFLVECNPRPTNGIALWPADDYDAALRAAPGEPVRLLRPGRRAKIAVALLRDMVRNPGEIAEDVRLLLDGSTDLYARADDLRPLLYTLLSYRLVDRLDPEQRDARSALIEAQFVDIAWNGEPIS